MKPWIYGYVLHFSDGGPPEERVLGYADSREECERASEVILGVTYSSKRPLEWAQFVWGRRELEKKLEAEAT